jgi:O-Antigen ligase
MSRFGNLTVRPPVPRPPTNPPLEVRFPTQTRDLRTGASPKATEPLMVQATSFQILCFITLCVYLLSGYINDITLHLLHTKAYLSTIAVSVLPLLLVLTGTISRGLKHPIGKLWIAFAVCLALSFPFSIWRTGTLLVLEGFYPKAYILYFYICACIVSGRQLHSMMKVLTVGSFLLLFECVLFGGNDESGRFAVLGSFFLSNANELGLQLLLNICFLLFAFFSNQRPVWKILSFFGIIGSALYMLKTGSRGEFLAFLIVAFTTMLFSRRKILFAIVSVPIICISLFMIPTHTLHRLTYIVTGDEEGVSIDLSARESQIERQRLLLDSIAYTFQYPLFGVGAGQFAVKVAGDKEKRGEHPEWLGTHNSYTQVSSETGLPAFVFYTLAIGVCIRINYVVFRRLAGRPEVQEFYAVALCMFLCAIAYAFSTFFFHIAYSYYFPMIAGFSVANYLTAKPLFQAQ